MLDLVVLEELKRKKKIPKEWLLKDRKKEFVVNGSRKRNKNSLIGKNRITVKKNKPSLLGLGFQLRRNNIS